MNLRKELADGGYTSVSDEELPPNWADMDERQRTTWMGRYVDGRRKAAVRAVRAKPAPKPAPKPES